MKSILFTFALWTYFPRLSHAQNVAMSASSGVAVATSSTGGLLTRLGDSETLLDPPEGISSFTDVAIDDENDSLVFALSVSPPRVCSYTLDQTTLSLVNCVGSSFATSPFCGISALGGTLVISGGVGGVTVFDYDTTSGELSGEARFENVDLGVIGNPDVLLLSPTRAAFSSDIGGSPRFGTLIGDLSNAGVSTLREIRNPNSSEFQNTISPSNFPFVNAHFDEMWLYTANGGMMVTSLDDNDSSGSPIVAPNPNFQAVTVDINVGSSKVFFGGLANGQSIIYSYDISTPDTPVLQGTMEVEGRITSIASKSGSIIFYVIQGGSTIESFQHEEMDIMTPSPMSSPTTASAPTTSSGADTSAPSTPTSGTVARKSLIACIMTLAFGCGVGLL